MSKVILVTVADDRSGRKDGAYGKTQDFIEHFFRNSNFGFTDYLMWKWADIEKSNYYEQYKHRLDIIDPQKNGRLYKPLLIKEGLSKIDEGDFLVYNDTSPELWKGVENVNISLYSVEVLKNLCIRNGGILTSHAEFNHNGVDCIGIAHPNEYNYDVPGYHTHEVFTNSNCFDVMDPERKYKYCLQHASGFVVLQKNEKSIKFINDWIHYNSIPACCESVEVETGQSHRCDQSISGLLINMLGNKLVRCLLGKHQHTVINPYNLLSFSQINTDYKFVESIQPMQNKLIYLDINKKENPDYIGKTFRDNWCVKYR